MEYITLGRSDCCYLENALEKEWLVTNGLGGYAAGTISGAITRRYHGLLVAALVPPRSRTLLVAKLDAQVHYDGDGKLYHLATNEYADGTIEPHGYRYLESFRLEGSIPVWRYALADARLEQRVWMAHGHNTTYITYTLAQGLDSMFLKLTAFCTYRDHHRQIQEDWQPGVETIPGGFKITAIEEAQPYQVVADNGQFFRDENWYWSFQHRAESYRGLDDTENLFVPGYFQHTLHPGQTLTLICSTESIEPHAGLEPLRQERERQSRLIQKGDDPDWIKQLTLAADQFIVQRSTENEPGVSIMAGYPWFGDWGRDTMIALPGLTLATDRPHIAAEILKTSARHINRGVLPNRLDPPIYNSVDASLWYFYAIHQYLLHTDDMVLIETLYPSLVDIIAWYQRGTHYNIHLDAGDGLLYAGEPGVQLTWMDAKLGDWVVTPRTGKPVEVNALWHNALRVMGLLAERLSEPEAAATYRQQAETMAETFRRRFWFESGEYLYDVIDGEGGEIGPDGKRYDYSLRPNQLWAVALPFPLLTDQQAKAVVDVCMVRLLTSYGLRSLDTDDPAYTGHYGGPPIQRDGAYHQGTVWAWLLGLFVRAHYRVYGNAQLARSFLAAIPHHLRDAGLGSVSEIFDGDPPHTPGGCFAQAWSVAEILRAWRDTQ